MDVLRFVMLLFDSIPLFSRFFVRYQFFVSYFFQAISVHACCSDPQLS